MVHKYNLIELEHLTTSSAGPFAVTTNKDAFLFCEHLSKRHYENFPVGSLLVPSELRPHFYSIYAFSRIADDLGDETTSLPISKRLELLQDFENLLDIDCPEHPIFRALTISRVQYSIPTEPFKRLIQAFRGDITFVQPKKFTELLSYCHNSANPVGQLLLSLFGEWNSTTELYSNQICTALQLLNFCQDLSRDLPMNRNYIPLEFLTELNLQNIDFNIIQSTEQFDLALELLLSKTNELFQSCIRLIHYIESNRLRMELSLIIGSGLVLYKKTVTQQKSLCYYRPKLTVIDSLNVFHQAMKLYNS